jgi:hypothetical protein
MYCTNCGKEFEGNFCPECGTKVNNDTSDEKQKTITINDTAAVYPDDSVFETPEKQKKPIYKRVWFWIIIVVLLALLVSCMGGGSSSDSGDKVSSSDTSVSDNSSSEKNEEDEEKAPAMDADTYKASCSSVDYKELARNPDNYTGQDIMFKGKIIQVQEDGNNAVYRVNVTEGEYGYWDDTIIVFFDKSDTTSRFLEDDIVTIYGQSTGIYTYETVLGSNMSIPSMLAYYMDLN